MAVKHTYGVRPGTILAIGIEDITDRYIFRAMLLAVVRAAAEHVNDGDIEDELSAVYNMMVGE
jgi:hypothetical protein